MKSFVMGAAIAALALSAVAASGNPFDAAYGNTVTQTMANGQKTIVYVNPNSTWEQHAGANVFKGTFAWKDATHVCFTVTDPAPKDPSKATNCDEIKGDHKVGETWVETTPDGQKITMAITAGR